MAILMQGLVLMVSGMGIVFLFLSLLVWVMNRMAKIIPRFNHILPDEAPKKKPQFKQQSNSDDISIAIAIAAVQSRLA